LREHQLVTVTVSYPAERWLEQEYMEQVKKNVAASRPAPCLDQVRQARSTGKSRPEPPGYAMAAK
jgi:hypothetical protein